MTLKTIIICIAIIFVIRIIYKFFLPVIGIYKTAQKAMKEMNRHQQQHMQNMQNERSSQSDANASYNKKPVEGEYIDYEEVKK